MSDVFQNIRVLAAAGAVGIYHHGTQTEKTCLAFKILGASRLCATQENVAAAFRFAFSKIKSKDAVVVGMFPKCLDQIALNVQYTMAASVKEPSNKKYASKN